MKYNIFLFPLLWYCFIGGIGYSIYLLSNDIHKIGKYFLEGGWFEHFWIFPFYLLSEFCFIVLNIIGQQKDKTYIDNLTEEDKYNSLENTAVIIPCHKGYNEIKNNRERLQFKFKNIFIADNNNNEGENEDFKEYCINYGMYYLYYSLPNKTNAILKTTEYIKNKFPFMKKIILLDDDTVVNNDFFIREDLLENPTTAGYTCCIGIYDIANKNYLEKWIDFEYRTISYRNRSRNFHTLKFLHGIICVYKI